MYYVVSLLMIADEWCRCFARPDQLENIDEPRFQELTEHLLEHFKDNVLWNSFGIDVTVQVCGSNGRMIRKRLTAHTVAVHMVIPTR